MLLALYRIANYASEPSSHISIILCDILDTNNELMQLVRKQFQFPIIAYGRAALIHSWYVNLQL
jgi:hypothetical protein